MWRNFDIRLDDNGNHPPQSLLSSFLRFNERVMNKKKGIVVVVVVVVVRERRRMYRDIIVKKPVCVCVYTRKREQNERERERMYTSTINVGEDQ